MVKHNKIYFRDTGILHSFLGINSIESLRTSPYRGFSFEGFVIESIIRNKDILPGIKNEYFFYRTAQGDEIDLLVKKDNKFTAYEIKTATSIHKNDLTGFMRCLDQLHLQSGTVIYSGKEEYSLDKRIKVLPVSKLLS